MLQPLSIPPPSSAPPAGVAALVRDAYGRIDEFARRRLRPGFVCSDAVLAYQGLRWLCDEGYAPDRRLVEWGSGFGVVACAARTLGFEACGIEIDPELVDEAERLAEDHGLAVPFACGTFVPEGGEELLDRAVDTAWLESGGADGHDALERDPDEFDVVFAFPWPGDEVVVEALFDRYAATGAVLLTYRGQEALVAHLKR